MPEMLLAEPPGPVDVAEGVEVRRLRTAEEAAEYWRIAASAYRSVGFPPEVFGHYQGLERLAAPGSRSAAAFLARLDGDPVGIAMTIVCDGVAGVYWVGCLEQARGRGIGTAVTTAAVEAGRGLGAEIASLQASPMGLPIYRAMGFETAWDYRLLLSPPP